MMLEEPPWLIWHMEGSEGALALQDTVREPKKNKFLFWDKKIDLSRSEPLTATP
jgi:hypothetical protein